VTASRSTSVTPDLAIYGVDLLTPLDTSFEDALTTLAGVGITASDFDSLYTTQRSEPGNRGNVTRYYLDWSFALSAPLANLKDTAAKLSSLSDSVAKRSGMALTYSLRNTQASPKALSALNCGAAELLSDARAQAQKLAGAAGIPVGQVVSVRGASVVTPASRAFSSGTVQPTCTLGVTFAQTPPETVTVAASRSLSLPPDQVAFQVTVRTKSTATVDDAVALLAGTPLTIANLTGAGNNYGYLTDTGYLSWNFEWLTSLSKIKDATTSLARAQQQAEKNNGAGALTYGVTRVQLSDAAARQACDSTALVNDARTEAGRIASAAGLNVGTVTSLSDTGGSQILAQRSGTFAASIASSIAILDPLGGGFSGFLLGAPYLYAPPAYTSPPTCSLIVVFRLIG
jgi:hypothetical protein